MSNRDQGFIERAGAGQVALALAGLALAAVTIHGCSPDEPVEAVPVAEYIKPDEPPTYAAPDGKTEHNLRFTDITATAGIDYTHVTGAFGKKWMPETMGGGAGFFDYDGDGRPDILLVNSRYWPGHEPENAPEPLSRLYRNLGDGRFEDVTETSGLDRILCYGMGAAMADYDGDGDADVYFTAVGKNHLLRNDAGVFSDVTEAAGVGFSKVTGAAADWEWSSGAAWLDHDRDGDLDLFVANYVQWTPETDIWTTLDGTTKSYATPQRYEGASCTLFRNNGDGTFADVTKQAGLYNPAGKSMGVVVDDFNEDGWPDIVVTNDTQPNFLYINNQDGTYTDHALSVGVAYDENGLARAGMGVSIADVYNGGRRSIAIGNFSGEPVSLYTQSGAQMFIDKAGATRLSQPTNHVLTFGVQFADLNLDGYADLLLANGHIEPEIEHVRENVRFKQPPQLFLNNRQGHFVDITDQLGDDFAAPMVGRAAAVADIDNDGDLDVLLTENRGPPRLLRNDLPRDTGVVRVRLRGPAENRDAIGAALRAHVAHTVVTRYVSTGGSYLSQSELTQTIGLGDADRIDELFIRWPNGAESRFDSLSANRIYTIHHDEGIVAHKPLH